MGAPRSRGRSALLPVAKFLEQILPRAIKSLIEKNLSLSYLINN
jgi:hypothetical protein